ncbi:MAG: hypothetical protein LBM01_02555 [Christensenellaceae bacterium]|jgi:hypothetical protein|nr:hypothetical protein [Christensenellaceae bacterium]
MVFEEILNGFTGRNKCNEGCEKKCSSSCDVLWIIILLMIVLKGGLFGVDLCTIAIIAIVFGKDLFKFGGLNFCK